MSKMIFKINVIEISLFIGIFNDKRNAHQKFFVDTLKT